MAETDKQHVKSKSGTVVEDDGLPPAVSWETRKAVDESIQARCFYGNRIIHFLEEAKRGNRSRDVIVLSHETVEMLMDIIVDGGSSRRYRAMGVLTAMLYEGKCPKCARSKVSTRTLSRYLKRAREMLALATGREDYLAIDLNTIRDTGTLLSYAHAGGFYIEDFDVQIL